MTVHPATDQESMCATDDELDAGKLVRERGVSVSQATRDQDLHENALRASVRELRRELAGTKTKRDILKKGERLMADNGVICSMS